MVIATLGGCLVALAIFGLWMLLHAFVGRPAEVRAGGRRLRPSPPAEITGEGRSRP